MLFELMSHGASFLYVAKHGYGDSDLTADAIIERFDGDVFATQRILRQQLLDQSVVRYKPARDLAAHMLLSLDDLDACWSKATHWLQQELNCHRVDAGFGSCGARVYYPGLAQAKNPNYKVPSFEGSAVLNQDPAMQAMWTDERPVAFADIKQDRRVSNYLRQRISGAKTKSKFGTSLRTSGTRYGLICADWTEYFAPHNSDLYDRFEQSVVDVLGPIIAVARTIADHSHGNPDHVLLVANERINEGQESWITGLTASELEVARLVVQGLSYKEVARVRGRSFSTIDHQLRSIRQKTGVSSTKALVSLLANTKGLHTSLLSRKQ